MNERIYTDCRQGQTMNQFKTNTRMSSDPSRSLLRRMKGYGKRNRTANRLVRKAPSFRYIEPRPFSIITVPTVMNLPTQYHQKFVTRSDETTDC